MVRALLEGDWERGRELHYELLPLFRALFVETNPIPVKTAASILGLCSDEMRLPMVPLQGENLRHLQAGDGGVEPPPPDPRGSVTRAPSIAVIGAAGRMGREVCRAALETEGIELAGGIVETGAPELGTDLGELCGLGKVRRRRDGGPAGSRGGPDRVHDARGDRRAPLLRETARHRDHGPLGRAAGEGRGGGAGRAHSPRPEHERRGEPVSRDGARALREARDRLRHRGRRGAPQEQKDAPSGTALLLARAAAEGRGRNLDEVAVFGREGLSAAARRVRSASTPCAAARSSASTALVFYSGRRRDRDQSTAPSPAAPSPTAL